MPSLVDAMTASGNGHASKREMKTDHLLFMCRMLDTHPQSPATALYCYIKHLLPNWSETKVIDMASCLIGSVGNLLINKFPAASLDEIRKLASTIVATIVPAGADFGIESVKAAAKQAKLEDEPQIVDASFCAWFDREGNGTILLSEHVPGKAPTSAILLPRCPKSAAEYERHIREVDREHDREPGAWAYRKLKVALA